MAGGGYTPDAIDAMPLGDVLALLRHWREQPPTHEILAAVLRIAPAAQDHADPSNIGALMARFPDGNVIR